MGTTTPPPISQPPATKQRARVGPIVRDVVIIVALTFIGGFVIPLVAAPSSLRGTLAASNLLLGTVGFVISGSMAMGSRWRHLGYVGLGVWLAGLTNVLFFGVSIVYWPLSIIFVALAMALGGLISYVFKRDTTPSA